MKAPFHRVNYTDAVAILQGKGSEIKWGDDLGAEDEALLVADYDRPVFVMNYPKEAKAFYMKENPEDPRTVLCDDCLAPEGYGEIIGGSQREDDYDKLLHRIHEEGLPVDAYGWYLDLRASAHPRGKRLPADDAPPASLADHGFRGVTSSRTKVTRPS